MSVPHGDPERELAYRERHPISARLHTPRHSRLAGGVTHDSWRVLPFAPVFRRARGAYKWDVDGHRFIDFWMGHGALLLGHGSPGVVEALREQAGCGFHMGGSSEVLHEWAAQVAAMVPSAQQLRFTSSGTEATMLALRTARAYTGRPLVLRLDGHFHGWHDEAMTGLLQPQTTGINGYVRDSVRIASPFDTDSVKQELEAGDVAALILEPGGGSGGTLPFDAPMLHELRRLTQAMGTLLVFDEVMSGFRYAPGGAQALAGVEPDLTVLAKVLCGGLPGGALCGQPEVMGVFGSGLERPHGHARVMHSGTFNGNPLAAAAGLATLRTVEDGEAQMSATTAAERLALEINHAAARQSVDVQAYAQASIFHLMIGALAEPAPAEPSAMGLLLQNKHRSLYAQLRRALLLEGIDAHASHGWLSTAHDSEVLGRAAEGFERAFVNLRELPGFGVP
ncbi:MAG: aminotransferase class III-fold pyridoxal phosphate-dependent enzyme [Nannocystaceae bacterium]|nr:aminotransferase class III-fold pyridoxal phosphate-dependent enzyme [Nannocystaceae bacterium]